MSDRYGTLARFESADALLAAARRMQADGHRDLDAFTPYPVHGLADALHCDARRVPVASFAAAVIAALLAYFMQWYSAVIDYPFVIGGKPLHSWPAFLLVTFACLILAAVLGAVFAMLVGNRLPMLYHPVFNAPAFARASEDGFFLLVMEDESDELSRKLNDLGAIEIIEVPA